MKRGEWGGIQWDCFGLGLSVCLFQRFVVVVFSRYFCIFNPEQRKKIYIFLFLTHLKKWMWMRISWELHDRVNYSIVYLNLSHKPSKPLLFPQRHFSTLKSSNLHLILRSFFYSFLCLLYFSLSPLLSPFCFIFLFDFTSRMFENKSLMRTLRVRFIVDHLFSISKTSVNYARWAVDHCFLCSTNKQTRERKIREKEKEGRGERKGEKTSQENEKETQTKITTNFYLWKKKKNEVASEKKKKKKEKTMLGLAMAPKTKKKYSTIEPGTSPRNLLQKKTHSLPKL